MKANNTYPEIISLTALVEARNISSKINEKETIHAEFSPIIFCINKQEIFIQVMDEYNDLDYRNELLTIILCIRELELIDDATHYKNWCQQLGIDSPNEALKNYYEKTVEFLPEIKKYFPGGKLNSFIPDLDFQLNAGAVQELRKSKK